MKKIHDAILVKELAISTQNLQYVLLILIKALTLDSKLDSK